MASEQRLIDMGKFLEVLRRYLNSSHVRKSGPVYCGMRIAIRSCIELLESQKPVDSVEVEDKELLKAIKILVEQYGHSKQSDYVHSPVAHALYHTWRKLDGERKGNE